MADSVIAGLLSISHFVQHSAIVIKFIKELN